MSRASTSSAKSLEELEKLEQQITLTLQEIDQNFNRAHRIVSTSILPIVDQYRDHSNALWEASKFWKQFFEASANITLCGVEENEQEDEDASYSQSHENTSNYGASHQDETLQTEGETRQSYEHDSLLDDPDLSGSTPRAPRPRTASSSKPKFAEYPSSYEALKHELKVGNDSGDEDTQIAPTTPGPKQRIPDMSMTPSSSPFDPTLYEPTSHLPSRTTVDPLLHRVLDKSYRLQATPHTARKESQIATKPSWRDSDSPMSSPVAAPELRSEIFSSPLRRQQPRPSAPRTPGVSVQTPATGKGKFKDVLQSRDANHYTQRSSQKDEITWESDSDEDADEVYKQLGMSPPKTIQFSLPQSRLLQTPAREASRRIVEDLLTTAGVEYDDSDALDSPSMVAMKDDLDDSF